MVKFILIKSPDFLFFFSSTIYTSLFYELSTVLRKSNFALGHDVFSTVAFVLWCGVVINKDFLVVFVNDTALPSSFSFLLRYAFHRCCGSSGAAKCLKILHQK